MRIAYCAACGRPLPWLEEADQSAFGAAVEQSPVPVLVDFWAPSSVPCRPVSRIVGQLARELTGRLKVVKINADHAQELGQRFSIEGIPTLILFDNGQVRDRLTGGVDAATLRTWLETRIAVSHPT
jgi:thioredoxin 2